MLRAGGVSPTNFPTIDNNASFAPITPASAAGPSAQTSQPAAPGASPPSASSPQHHRQAYIEHNLNQVKQQGYAPGLVHPVAGTVPPEVEIERRDSYMHFRTTGIAPVAAMQAAAEWNEMAVTFATKRATEVFDQHRMDYVRAHVMSVLTSCKAPGLSLFGRNIETRESFLALRIVGTVQANMEEFSKRAISDWNKLAAAHARDAGERMYARLYPVDTQASAIFEPPVLFQEKPPEAPPPVPMQEPEQVLFPVLATGSEDMFPPIPGLGDIDAPLLPLQPQEMTLEFVSSADKPVLATPGADAALEAAYAAYQAFLATLSTTTEAAMLALMKTKPDLFLFNVHTDLSLVGHPLDPRACAAKTLLAR